MRDLKVHIKNLSEGYLDLWKRLKHGKLFLFFALHYSLVFAILSFFIFSDFREAGKTLIWTADGMPGYFMRLTYLSQTIREGIQSLLRGEGWTIPLYDFRIGPVKLNLQAEPVEWLAVLFPWDRMDTLHNILVIMRYYMMGLSFSIFGFYFRQKPIAVLIGAISYTFGGFSLYAGVRHPFFLSPMIYLPLLIVAIEKVIQRKNPFLFAFVVFLALISNLYFACMLAILVCAYILIRFPLVYRNNRMHEFGRMLGRVALSGGIGIALSGIVSYPTLIQMFGTGRVGREIGIYANLLKYSDTYYQKFFADFLVVPGDIGSWTCLGFSVLTFPAVLLLFLDKEKTKSGLKFIFLLLTAMLWIPAVSYVMSGFNALSNRWCFAYAFCVAAILMFEIPRLFTANKQELLFVGSGTIVYFVVCYFLIGQPHYISAPFLLLSCFAFLFGLYKYSNRHTQTGFLLLCLLITCFSTYYSAFLMYDAKQGNYISQFTANGVPYQNYDQSQYSSVVKSVAVKNDNTFYRVTGDSISRQSMNSSFYTGVNGLTYFISTYYQPYREWQTEMELAQLGFAHMNFGIQTRAPLLTFAGVKYYVMRETGKEILPYGFQEIDRIQNGKSVDIILENQYFLPLGYTYENYLMRDSYDSLSGLEKQEAQLQSILLEQAPISAGIREKPIETTMLQCPVIVTGKTGLNWKDGTLKVTEENATMTLEFTGVPCTETYLRVVNLDLTSGGSSRRWDLTAATEETTARAKFIADANIYAHGLKTQLLDLGYTEDGYTTCTLTFPSKGTFKLEGLEIWCQPMDNYGAQINALREEVLENIETNWRGLRGTISVSKDKMLCISLPYDEGWSAYVDGKKVNLYRANTAFMAVELTAGTHEIELRYWMPGLTAGIALSAIGLVGCVIYVFYLNKRKGVYSKKST